VSWRWCFYINLPIGAVSAGIILFFFQTPKQAVPEQAPVMEKIRQMDFPGIALVMGATISYILAVQYGGVTEAWNSSVVVGLLVGFVAMFPVILNTWTGVKAVKEIWLRSALALADEEVARCHGPVHDPGRRQVRVVHRLGHFGMAGEPAAFAPHPGLEIGDQRRDRARRAPRRSSAGAPLSVRSKSKIASIRLTASTASGATAGSWPRTLRAMSASTKNLRRAWAQHAASMTGPGRRPGS
jgi:hypothetical protein